MSDTEKMAKEYAETEFAGSSLSDQLFAKVTFRAGLVARQPEIDALHARIADLVSAGKRYRAAVHALSEIQPNRKTLWECTPSVNQKCFDAFIELNDAGRNLTKVIGE